MRTFLFSIFLFINLFSFGQNPTSIFGFFPEAQLSYKTANEFKISTKIESQQGVINTSPDMNPHYNYYHNQTDFQGFIGKSINPFVSVTIGYQYRIDPQSNNSNRSIQQISFVQPLTGIKLGHRIRTDQTFAAEENPEFRGRYRLSAEIPLSGQSLDPTEFYCILSDEGIISHQNDDTGFENRFVFGVGKLLTKHQKVQVAIDYRTDKFSAPSIRHRTWFKFGWFASFSAKK